MSEYEIIDAMNSTMANAWTVSQYGLTIITGFLLMAHFIGRQLTTFQAWFVCIVFLVMHTMNIVSLVGISRKVQLLQIELMETGSALSTMQIISSTNRDGIIPWPPYLAGGLMAFGCLYFMWQVRHPKTE